MRKLNANEIVELKKKPIIRLFSNFEQLVNGTSDQDMVKGLNLRPYYLRFPISFYEDKTGNDIYDMGNGYYLSLYSPVFPCLSELHTMSIYKVAKEVVK